MLTDVPPLADQIPPRLNVDLRLVYMSTEHRPVVEDRERVDRGSPKNPKPVYFPKITGSTRDQQSSTQQEDIYKKSDLSQQQEEKNGVERAQLWAAD